MHAPAMLLPETLRPAGALLQVEAAAEPLEARDPGAAACNCMHAMCACIFLPCSESLRPAGALLQLAGDAEPPETRDPGSSRLHVQCVPACSCHASMVLV